jgi:NEDD4-binding protein 2
MLSSATEPSNSSSSQSVIIEVPRIVSEPPISDNTNDNCITQSTTEVRTEKVHNSFALNPQIHHLPISPLNAVMPFANLFSPKHNNSFSSNAKSSHQLKAKKYSLKDEIKSMIQNANQKVLIIMRGLPGSGKSTLAHYLVNGCATGVIISTDHYFTRNGVYNFDPSQLPDAHEWNQKRAKDYIQSGTSPVIIDNTNLEAWEMKPYVSFGHNNGYKIYFLEPDTPWNRNPKELSKKNIHNISKERIENMIYKFANVTVEDVIKSLPTKPLIKSNFVEKVETKSFTETKATTNESLKDLKISLSNIGPSSSNADEDPEECSTSSVSTKPDEVPSSPSQRESSTSQSNDTTEPTSPSSPTCIDIELLLALSERHVDSEDCSSINASEGGSSGISQESGWERDEEFTWSNNNQHNVLNDNDNGYKGFDSTVEPTVDNKNLNEFLDSDPKPKRERKPRNLENKEKCIKEENAEDLEFNEPWDEEDVKNLTKNSNNSFDNGLESSSQTNNNKRMFGLFGIPNYNWEFPPFPINDSNHSTNNTSEISITCYSRQTQTERKDWALLELSQSNKPKEGLETESVEEKENLVSSQFFPNRNVQKVKLHKGTFTNDLPDDMTKAQKLQSLKINFPKAEDSHLNEILDACHENYGWANKLLSEFNDDHFDVATLEQIANESQVSTPDNNSEFDVTKEEELPLESVNQKSSEEPKFVLNLDPNLAAQLELHFGPVSDKSLFNCEDLTVTLSHGVARLLHHNWKKSLNQKPIAQSYPQSSTKISINHNFIDYKSKGLLLEENTPKTEFQEIMDYELAVSLSRQEYDDKLASKLNALGPSQNPKAKELLSTKLKRDQLYLRYPGVDKGFLDEIFESHK